MVVNVPGLRRVAHVEVVDEGGVVRFYAAGTGHRRPMTVPITRAMAAELAGRVRFVERGAHVGALPLAPEALQSVDG